MEIKKISEAIDINDIESVPEEVLKGTVINDKYRKKIEGLGGINIVFNQVVYSNRDFGRWYHGNASIVEFDIELKEYGPIHFSMWPTGDPYVSSYEEEGSNFFELRGEESLEENGIFNDSMFSEFLNKYSRSTENEPYWDEDESDICLIADVYKDNNIKKQLDRYKGVSMFDLDFESIYEVSYAFACLNDFVDEIKSRFCADPQYYFNKDFTSEEDGMIEEDIDINDVESVPVETLLGDVINDKVKSKLEDAGAKNVHIYDEIYSERDDPRWYNDSSFAFDIETPKGIVRIIASANSDDFSILSAEEDESSPAFFEFKDVWQLEENGIMNDKMLSDFIRNYESQYGSNSICWDNDYCEFNFVIVPLDKNGDENWSKEIYSWDIAGESFYSFKDLLEYVLSIIPDISNGEIYDENKDFWFDESDSDKQEEKSLEEKVENTKSDKKKITIGNIYNSVVKEFGFVKSPLDSDATFILPTGKVLNTKGHYDKSQHENVADFIEKVYNINDKTDNMSSRIMEKLNSIRFTGWIPGIVIPQEPLTEQQEEVLYEALIKLKSNKKVSKDTPLMISNIKGDQFVSIDTINNPEDILTTIFRYHATGVLNENYKGEIPWKKIKSY